VDFQACALRPVSSRAQPFFRRSEGSREHRHWRVLDFVSTKTKEGAPSFASFAKEPALSLSKGGNHGRPQRLFLTLMLPLTLPVWNGHSCPLPLTFEGC